MKRVAAIAVVHDDATIPVKALGQHDVEGGLPVTPDMQFALCPGSLHGSLCMRPDIRSREDGVLLMATVFSLHPFLRKLYADGGHQVPQFQAGLCQAMHQVEVEIVKRSDAAKGFTVLPKRWIIERTIAWLNRCRRLAKDRECLNREALAFLRLVFIRLMLRKLCQNNGCFRIDTYTVGISP